MLIELLFDYIHVNKCNTKKSILVFVGLICKADWLVNAPENL